MGGMGGEIYVYLTENTQHDGNVLFTDSVRVPSLRPTFQPLEIKLVLFDILLLIRQDHNRNYQVVEQDQMQEQHALRSPFGLPPRIWTL